MGHPGSDDDVEAILGSSSKLREWEFQTADESDTFDFDNNDLCESPLNTTIRSFQHIQKALKQFKIGVDPRFNFYLNIYSTNKDMWDHSIVHSTVVFTLQNPVDTDILQEQYAFLTTTCRGICFTIQWMLTVSVPHFWCEVKVDEGKVSRHFW